jgi:integrase
MFDVGKHIESMLVFKESLGYSRNSYEWVLKDFKKYMSSECPGAESLDEEAAMKWLRRRETENPSGYRARVTKFNEFLKYLNSIGEVSFKLPPNFTPKVVRYTPYIFTDAELARIFEESDKVAPNPQSPLRHLIIPVIYRLIYFCGLRPNEGRELLRSDVDLAAGVLFIRKNKAHSERYVPMSDDLRDLCVSYNRSLDRITPGRKWFFPSPAGKPYGSWWLTDNFLALWERAKGGGRARIRVYDLRHRYATAIMMKWLDEGADLSSKLLYLSQYMGHTQLSDTAYYIHLLPERLARTPSVDWARMNSLIPEAARDE